MRLWASLLAVALFGCSNPAPPISGSGCTKQALQSFLFNGGVPWECSIVPDKDYHLPSRAWLEEFCGKLTAEQSRRGMDRFLNPENNCSKFARFASAYAAEIWYKDPNRVPGRAIAFGSVFYFSRAGGHAINCAVIREGEKLALVLIEPQGAKFLSLKPEEIRTGLFIF